LNIDVLMFLFDLHGDYCVSNNLFIIQMKIRKPGPVAYVHGM